MGTRESNPSFLCPHSPVFPAWENRSYSLLHIPAPGILVLCGYPNSAVLKCLVADTAKNSGGNKARGPIEAARRATMAGMGSEAPSVSQLQLEVIYASETEGSTARDRITAEKSIQNSSLRLSKLCGVKMLGGWMPSSACRSTDTRSRGANTAQPIGQPVAQPPFSPACSASVSLKQA